MRALLVATLLSSCSSLPIASPTPSATSTAQIATPSATPKVFVVTPDADRLPGGCGQTTVYRGGMTSTLIAATGNNPPPVPYAVAHPPVAAAFLFNIPMRASSGLAPTNKVLWVVATPRTGDLIIDGHPRGQTSPTVHYEQQPNSGPGDIYPSSVDVPSGGCWQFTLRWAGQVAEIEFEYS